MNPKTISKQISQAIFWLLIGTVFLVPVFFNPLSANLFILSKTLLLSVVASVLIILWMAYGIITRTFRITVTPFTLPLFLLLLISLISSWGPLPQTIEGFVNATASTLFLFFIFLIGTTLKRNPLISERINSAVIASGVFLAFAAILETVKLGPSRWISLIFPSLPQSSEIFINPAGSAVILITLLIPILIMSLLFAFDRKDYLAKSLYFGASAFITAALVISIFNILPGKPNAPVFTPFGTSWQIAAENIKNPRAFLIGVGPQHYVAAFSANKNIEFNSGDFWNTRFSTAANVPLHLFTTVGLLGLGAWLMLLFAIFRLFKNMSQLSNAGRIVLLGLSSIVIINLIVPVSLTLQALFIFLLIALSHDLKAKKLPGTSEILVKLFAIKKVDSQNFDANQEEGKTKRELLPLIIGVPLILLALANLFGTYRVAYADVLYRRSLEAAAQNNGTGTYNNQRDAVTQNPFMSSYHRSYATTNLALANAIAAQGESLSDQDRNNVTTLIQQAIREGRTAVIINPKDPANWETLAGIYRNLINVAEGAVEWSTASYAEAIRRDPANPRLRIELGGIFYQLQDYPSAVRIFEQAVNLKPNWANAHYNLANAYRESDMLAESAAQYEVVLAMIDPTTADYTVVVNELNQVREQLGQAADAQAVQPQPGELTQPEPLPSPLPDQETIDLGEDSAPPTPEETGESPAPGQGGFNQITNPSPSPAAQTETPAETPEQ